MKILISFSGILFVVSAMLFVVTFTPASGVYAQEVLPDAATEETEEDAPENEEAAADEEAPATDEEGSAENDEKESKEEEESASGVAYEYVAQPGDSYALIARKAVQTYGLKEEVDLSRAQIVFAETQLTQAANAPLLSVGQEVTIQEADIAREAEQALKLSEAEEAAWNQYAQYADFNTDNVGQVRE